MRNYFKLTYITAILFIAVVIVSLGLTGTTLSATTAPAKTVVSPPAPTVILNNQQLSFEVPPIIENDRTLVPLGAIFEAMGAKVSWDDATSTVTATKGTTTVILPIGSTSPTVNGAVWKLAVPAKLVKDRTLAPLRFVGEAFGGNVGWDESNSTVNIQAPLNVGSVVVGVTVGPVGVNLRSGPDRSFALISSALPGERLEVLDEQNGWYQVTKGSQKAWAAGWVVDVTWQEAAPVIPTPPPVVTVPSEPIPQLEGLRLSSAQDASGLRIIMESGVKLDTKISPATGKVSYEFANVQIDGSSTLQQYMGSQLLTAQANQRDNSVLVEIQIPAGIEYRTSTENGGLRAVLTIPNFITGVERKTFGSGGENISISSLVPLTYTSTQTGTVMEVVFNNILPGKAQTSYNFASSLISTMGFQKKTVGTTVQTVLTLTTTKTAKFAVGLSSNGSVLNIMFIDQSQIQPRIPMVVLDAGHGGRDPGANGFNLNEKDVNLAIVLKVGELLTQNGIKVVYTRKDDTYVDLDLRSSMANLYNAALFVSLHSNANLSPDPSGTETYYYAPLENPELYIQKDERSKLAACLQQSLVAKLGRNDRGIKQGNLSVLRETVMPSALIELAFISNPIEGELLKQQQFRDSAAQAIADGITGYMNNVNLDNVRP